MWNFSELAKKAQELTEQTTHAGSLFNLDSMQEHDLDQQQNKRSQQTLKTTTSALSPSIFSFDSLQGQAASISSGTMLFGSPSSNNADASLGSSLFSTPVVSKHSASSLFESMPSSLEQPLVSSKGPAEAPSLEPTAEAALMEQPLIQTPARSAVQSMSSIGIIKEPLIQTPAQQTQTPIMASEYKTEAPIYAESKGDGNNLGDDWDFDDEDVGTNVSKQGDSDDNHKPTTPNKMMEQTRIAAEEIAKEAPKTLKSTDIAPLEMTEGPDVVARQEPKNLASSWGKEDDLEDMYDDDDDDDDEEEDADDDEDPHDEVNHPVELKAQEQMLRPIAHEPDTVDLQAHCDGMTEHHPDDNCRLDSKSKGDVTSTGSTSECYSSQSDEISAAAFLAAGGMLAAREDEILVQQSDVLLSRAALEDASNKESTDQTHIPVVHTEDISPNNLIDSAPLTDDSAHPSLEDEIAGMLYDNSQPEVQTYDEDRQQMQDDQLYGNKLPSMEDAEIQGAAAEQPEIGTIAAPASWEGTAATQTIFLPDQVLPTEKRIVTKILSSHSESSERMIPASVLDQFTHQMQRLEEHHHREIQELQMLHAEELQDARNSISHDVCMAERAELEQRFMGKFREKEEQLQEIMRINEGMELKMDVLKRELEGTRKLLEERDTVIGSASAAHDRDKQMMEEKLKSIEESAGTAKADIYQLQTQLKAKQDELDDANEAYSALKARVKIVATELKERRVECRTLAQSNVELSDANEQLQALLTNFQSQMDDQNRSDVEKAEEMDQLRDTVKTLEEELKEADKKIHERDAVGEKALSAYKKKAQNSLAIANARAAAALQAKEEAELEARAARSTADEAVERARKSEAKGQEALEEAKAYVKEMQEQSEKVERRANEAINSLSSVQAELDQANAELSSAYHDREKMANELKSSNIQLDKEKGRTSELLGEMADLQKRCNDLYDEVETVREELRKSATAAFMAQNSEPTDMNGAKDISSARPVALAATDKSESEATILMLQRELRDANQAIKELKETLRTTIESQSHNGTGNNTSRPHSNDPVAGSQGNTNDSTPLFFAFEKQAELNQAREEINRLATLLGELQAEKVQACEAAEHMKQEKEDAEARLARYEKLGPTGSVKRKSSAAKTKPTASYATYGTSTPNRRIDADVLSIGPEDSSDSIDNVVEDSAQVNLEYLKNVILSYLKAKTLNERKRLLPAVAAVLCLTPQEAAMAMKSIEQSASVESVGVSLFESLGVVRSK